MTLPISYRAAPLSLVASNASAPQPADRIAAVASGVAERRALWEAWMAAGASANATTETDMRMRDIAALLARLGPAERTPRTLWRAERPLLASATMSSPGLANALAAAVEASGLFYESHLAEWYAGYRSLPELKAEQHLTRKPVWDPQAGMARPPDGDSPGTPGAGAVVRDSPHPQSAAMTAEQGRAIHHQLHVLEHREILWSGELWPGQRAQWSINDGGGESHRHDQPAENRWRSRLTLTLPRLGSVQATLELNGFAVSVHVETGASAAQTLTQDRAALQAGLAQAGLALADLRIGGPVRPGARHGSAA